MNFILGGRLDICRSLKVVWHASNLPIDKSSSEAILIAISLSGSSLCRNINSL